MLGLRYDKGIKKKEKLKQNMCKKLLMELKEVLDQFDDLYISPSAVITQLKHEEDDDFYQVWKIESDSGTYILKEAKGDEKDFYASLPDECKEYVPFVYQTITLSKKTYLLMEYIDGENLCRCNRNKLILALDALIQLQNKTWNLQTAGF